MNASKRQGDRGEALAARYLEERGCRVLDRQWRCPFGELDLVILSPSGMVCFVEVKTRKDASHGLPREFVDARKQERLRQTAALWLAERGMSDAFVRFDVAEVYYGGGCAINYLEDAFQ